MNTDIHLIWEKYQDRLDKIKFKKDQYGYYDITRFIIDDFPRKNDLDYYFKYYTNNKKELNDYYWWADCGTVKDNKWITYPWLKDAENKEKVKVKWRCRGMLYTGELPYKGEDEYSPIFNIKQFPLHSTSAMISKTSKLADI